MPLYSVGSEPDDDGTLLITHSDLPEVITFTENLADVVPRAASHH